MKVLVCSTRYGPTVAFLKPTAKDPLGHASIRIAPACIVAPIVGQVASRGTDLSWEKFCAKLTSQPSHLGTWTVESVRDGLSPRLALAEVRSQAGLFDRSQAKS